MLLAIDIGNTNIVLGLYQGKKLITHWRLATQAERTADEYGVIRYPPSQFPALCRPCSRRRKSWPKNFSKSNP
jgi:hypothetical protein